MDYLPSIQSPQDLKSLSLNELEVLADEIRRTIIDVMAINGGHLGSNMGIVELSLCLHKLFDSPFDKLIFDVSHQTYPHKLLTGRQELFPTIRQFQGLSGFAHPEESEHDHFYAGHAGTALSLALGLARVRDLKGEDSHILPIVGDATFTCGLTLEALNNLPKDLKRFILILNDNNMSISSNVGAIPHILEKRGPSFFEQYGLNYVGPVDGHNLEELLRVLSALKGATTPTLLHVLTVKGKGLTAAEQDPVSWHGCSPFDKVTGKKFAKVQSKPKFPQVFGDQLERMAECDPTLITVTPAMPHGSCITPLLSKYPERSIDVGIAEGHAVTFAGAMASRPDTKVVCSIYATFLQRALDNLFQDVCLQKAPVLFALDRAGLAAGDGATHHGIYDIAFLNAMPEMVICQPRDGKLLRELMMSAFAWQRPTAIRYPNTATEDPELPLLQRELGKGEVLEKGSEIALIALGNLCTIAYEVKELLAQEGITATIVDPIFLKPLDRELFEEIFLSHKYIATIEEHAVNSGLGAILNTFAAQNRFDTLMIRNFGIPDTFLDQGSHKEIFATIGLDPACIARQIVKDVSEETLQKVPL
jgi:1-deoxy-D-xylulose-5-phosphate synthase